MLPKGFRLENLDDGIRNVVVDLNRIPGVNIQTTPYGPTSCEGHDGNDGWLYFYKAVSRRKGLMKTMEQFCSEFPFFSVEMINIMDAYDFSRVSLEPPAEKFGFYQIVASFEPIGNPERAFNELQDIEEQKPISEETNLRKLKILKGWNALDSRLLDYIFHNITKDIDSLPYMSKEDVTFVRPVCPHGH